MSTRRARAGIYGRDGILLAAGLLLIFKQAGILFPPPQHISVEILLTGGLLCNGPLFIQVLTIVRTFWQSEPPEQQEQDSLPASSSASSPDDP